MMKEFIWQIGKNWLLWCVISKQKHKDAPHPPRIHTNAHQKCFTKPVYSLYHKILHVWYFEILGKEVMYDLELETQYF